MTRLWAWLVEQRDRLWRYFASGEPSYWHAFVPLLALVTVLYARVPTTNYIFDEQEALLANPYVNQVGFRYEEAIYRDFWGLPPNGSIGSYRPIPNYLWRGLVELGERGQWLLDREAAAPLRTLLSKALEPGEQLPTLQEVARRSFFQHLYNLILHAAVGAGFVVFGYRMTRDKLSAWLFGLVFVTAAILTEAVCGAVGIADILGGLGAIAALLALGLRAHAMPFAVFLAVLFGLFSKESAMVCVPLVPVAALLFAPILHPHRPARLARSGLALMATIASFILYVELRKRWYPAPLPEEFSQPLPSDAGTLSRLARDFMIWIHQAPLPRDPLNNPLVDAPPDLRFGGAMRVYARGLTQVVFPWNLSGDYSFPQEPVPERMLFPESLLGWFATVMPLGAGLGLFGLSVARERYAATELPPAPAVSRRSFALELGLVVLTILFVGFIAHIGPSPLNEGLGDPDPRKNINFDPVALVDLMVLFATGALALGALTEACWSTQTRGSRAPELAIAATGLVWLVVSYFPHSNLPVLLPTVRAERLWYFPVLGTTMVLALLLRGAYRQLARRGYARLGLAVLLLFFGFQSARAYWHATDYRNDLEFWKATKDAVPNSAKAHLNYSVMEGARGRMDIRLLHSERARQLAPRWAMAHIYTGDALCRTERPDEAWPHYATGFALGPNDKGLIALALQCLFDEKKITEHEQELRALVADHEGSWLAYLVLDILQNGERQGGVAPEHRPRSYNEGPRKSAASGSDSAEGETGVQGSVDGGSPERGAGGAAAVDSASAGLAPTPDASEALDVDASSTGGERSAEPRAE